jgi:hypothetical protein
MSPGREGGSLLSEGTSDRRRSVRRAPTGDEPLSHVRLRAGRQLEVINVSDTGLLAEGEMRLLPGTHVDVHLVTAEGRLLIRSRVIRAFVCRVCKDRIDYRGAIAFERPVSTGVLGYPMPEAPEASSAPSGKPYPDRAVTSHASNPPALSP